MVGDNPRNSELKVRRTEQPAAERKCPSFLCEQRGSEPGDFTQVHLYSNATSHTLARSPIPAQISKHGILFMSGFGLRLQVQNGRLSAAWRIGEERHNICLPRVNRNLRRVIVIASDGFATFDAIRWITDIGASLTFVDRRASLSS